MKRLLLIGCGLWFGAWCGLAQERTNVAPEADRILRAACQYLAESPHFMLTAEVWREHVTASGQKVQFCRQAEMEVKRPNRLHMEIHSPHTARGFWYDGKSLAILDRNRNFFSTAPMPKTLDETLDAAHDDFGIDLPLVDMAVSDPYKSAMAKVESATYYGLSPALGFECHHLAFTQENIDWQIWIQAGPQPFIRKLVITHKNEEGAPEFTALITHWDFTERISDSNFVFEPPKGASKIEMRKIGERGASGKSSAPLARPKEQE